MFFYRTLFYIGRRKLVLFVFVALLVGCSGLPIDTVTSENFSSRVKYIVIHSTVVDFRQSVNILARGNASSHYLIPEHHDRTYPSEDLRITQLVDDDLKAWHAGVSHWGGVDNLNESSIGIELVNMPQCYQPIEAEADNDGAAVSDDGFCLYPDYDPEQIQLLIALMKQLQQEYPGIKPQNIVAHADIAPSRKQDPGPLFPWHQLYKKGIGAWYDAETVNQYRGQLIHRFPSVEEIQRAFQGYGYPIEITGNYDQQTQAVVLAFQAHFLPWKVDKKLDLNTVAVLFALLEKYRPTQLQAILNG